eukprot:CAMPEP_0206228144 /NCGR_PEP_ID=MMETSP0047_2-20121206/9011_1 /ASSEMBLY_ACC=CAM_ASM_000192 /TAXON_ID=195065 /ORGANISM="Chroomonas mesostigmatica_cf, Strain CCMP1168" /LENGTH=161 /DNA_ID=CAMNT_0053651365 /DNA_START=143 /DNA_END=628 /DNA_ORIENTATION=+
MTPEENDISKSTPLYRFDVQQAPPQAPIVPSTEESTKFMQKFLAENKVSVFSLEYCEFCWSATKMLTAAGVPYGIINVDALMYSEGNFGGQVRTSVCELTGAKTFPQIFINGEFVGGCTDLFDKWKAGEAQTKLEAAKIPFERDAAPAPYTFLPKWLAKRG